MTCPTPRKPKYPTQAAAIRRAVVLRADQRVTRDQQQPYLCECGWWHLTSPKDLTHRIRIALRRGRPS